MLTQAAILVNPGQPLVVDDVEVPALKPGQALVEIHYSGVCHTQLLECQGARGHDPYLPHCLGHEGSGIVCDVGPGTTKVKPGDRVILSWIKGSGQDVPGTTYSWTDRTVNAGAITTFNRHAVISENRLTRIPDEIPLDEAALFGCALPTGMGSVLNTASARAGNSLVVFGTGGVGLAAVAGAKLSGCAPIIAVDPIAERRELACAMGATHAFDPMANDVLQSIRDLCRDGVDIAVEATGKPAVMQQALSIVRPRGGVAVVVGNARHGETVTVDPRQLNQGKQLRGTWGGDCVPDRDFPRYCQWLVAGRLSLKPLLSRPFALEEINDALHTLEKGTIGRPLVAMRTAA